VSNQEQLEEEWESEREIHRIRKAMEKMSPKERVFYEKFLKDFWPKVLEDLKKDAAEQAKADEFFKQFANPDITEEEAIEIGLRIQHRSKSEKEDE
jgi:hypothetical protein